MIRRITAALVVLAALTLSSLAWSGSYLDRAALLVEEAHHEGDVLQPRSMDKETILVIKALAEARTKAGRKMDVPAAVAKAHPHLLLVLENCERAADAAAEGNFKKLIERLNAAREEERTFRTILGELGYTLPDLSSKKP